MTTKYHILVPAGTDVARFDAMPIGHRYISITAERDTEVNGEVVRAFIIGADIHAEFSQGWNVDSGATPTVAGWNRGISTNLMFYELSTTDRVSDGNGGFYARILWEIQF